jgi:hypothetical protein
LPSCAHSLDQRDAVHEARKAARSGGTLPSSPHKRLWPLPVAARLAAPVNMALEHKTGFRISENDRHEILAGKNRLFKRRRPAAPSAPRVGCGVTRTPVMTRRCGSGRPRCPYGTSIHRHATGRIVEHLFDRIRAKSWRLNDRRKGCVLLEFWLSADVRSYVRVGQICCQE